MARLIETTDGILIEVEADGDEKSSAGAARKVQKSMEQIVPLLRKACGTMREFWTESTDGVSLDEVQIEFGVSFEAEGNAYLARAKAGATMTVTATLKRPA